jgi:hypothetical protein
MTHVHGHLQSVQGRTLVLSHPVAGFPVLYVPLDDPEYPTEFAVPEGEDYRAATESEFLDALAPYLSPEKAGKSEVRLAVNASTRVLFFTPRD